MVSVEFLAKSILTLEEALAEYNSGGSLLMRDGVIQRFEYTFELTIRTLQRMLKEVNVSEESLIDLTYKTTIRLAYERGWLDSPELWFDFREARNKTSHAYSNSVAAAVFLVIPGFVSRAKDLLSKLEQVEQ